MPWLDEYIRCKLIFYAGSGTAESYLNIYRNTTRHLRIGRCQTGPPRVVSDKYGGAVGMTVSCFLSEAPRPSILAPRLTFSRRFASAPSPLPRPISWLVQTQCRPPYYRWQLSGFQRRARGIRQQPFGRSVTVFMRLLSPFRPRE